MDNRTGLTGGIGRNGLRGGLGSATSASPYAPIVALSPTTFVPLLYASTAADGQILYKDSGATTPVTSGGDPIGAVVWDGAVVATQTTDADRLIWQPGRGAVASGGSEHLLVNVTAPAGTSGYIHQVASRNDDTSITHNVSWLGVSGVTGRGVIQYRSDGKTFVRVEDDATDLDQEIADDGSSAGLHVVTASSWIDAGRLYSHVLYDSDAPLESDIATSSTGYDYDVASITSSYTGSAAGGMVGDFAFLALYDDGENADKQAIHDAALGVIS
jgi:hypothetical protein